MFEITRADAISALSVDESTVFSISLRNVSLWIQFRCRSCENCSLLPMFRHTLLETTRADAASVCGSNCVEIARADATSSLSFSNRS